jgi:transglutaminase-like putative cysteine protease
MLAGIVAMWASVFSCHALAFRAGSPLLALVPPVALVAFADTVLEESVRPLYGVAFLLGALAVVFADSIRRTQSWGPVWSGRTTERSGVVGASGRGARRLGVAALALAAFAPIAMPGFGSSGLIDVSSITGDDDTVLVDPLVSIASELTRDDPVDVLSVQTETPSYLRMLTLPDFDGITWRRDETSEGSLVSQELRPPIRETFEQRITVLNDLGFPWIPMAAEPVFVDLAGEMTWDAESASILIDDPLDARASYRTESELVQPSPEALSSTDAVPQGDIGRYLALPTDLPPQIGALAREWTAGAGSDYAKVLAIQERLQGAGFHYDTTVELRDDSNTLVEFLTETKTGFCQQFASSMAVMLRLLGIPARVAVGFTAGDEDPGDPGTYTISTENLHSWVEVPFGDYGWLAFEPTPGLGNPVASRYQDPEQAAVCRGRSCAPNPFSPPAPGDTVVAPTPRGRLATPGPVAGAVGAGDSGGSTDLRGALMWAGVALALIALMALPLARSWIRRRRLRRARGEPRRMVLATYDVLAQRAADLGAGRGPGETPREYLHRLETSGRLDDGPLARLTALATRAAYAPDPLEADDALDAEADAREVLRSLRRTTPPLQRLAGAYRPRG